MQREGEEAPPVIWAESDTGRGGNIAATRDPGIRTATAYSSTVHGDTRGGGSVLCSLPTRSIGKSWRCLAYEISAILISWKALSKSSLKTCLFVGHTQSLANDGCHKRLLCLTTRVSSFLCSVEAEPLRGVCIVVGKNLFMVSLGATFPPFPFPFPHTPGGDTKALATAVP